MVVPGVAAVSEARIEMTFSDSAVVVTTLTDKKVLLQHYVCSNHRICGCRKAKWFPPAHTVSTIVNRASGISTDFQGRNEDLEEKCSFIPVI